LQNPPPLYPPLYLRGIEVRDLPLNPTENSESRPSTVAQCIASKVAALGNCCTGLSGLSSIGAVVGATYPTEARELRKLMPRAIFLVPGFGSQGGSAEQAMSGAIEAVDDASKRASNSKGQSSNLENSSASVHHDGIIVNMSRGLFELNPKLSRIEWMSELEKRVDDANRALSRGV
jgi:hypothetical protein